ncbi:hypothetical protein EVAR_42611_1 [Eumeta japonica]|uniref:Uncharacterized protein n=1 Tax=Eumeta variegata TaxID=151549 RepID=A0A4C1XNF4_EUMVA|nr:hypothetical protein EVAR_42611_1 [Eumeta japonica]
MKPNDIASPGSDSAVPASAQFVLIRPIIRKLSKKIPPAMRTVPQFLYSGPRTVRSAPVVITFGTSPRLIELVSRGATKRSLSSGHSSSLLKCFYEFLSRSVRCFNVSC